MSCCKYLYPIWTSVTRNVNLIFISTHLHTRLVSFWCFIKERFYISISQIFIYIYIYIYINKYKIYTYIYIYICNHENNVPSWSSPQWRCGNSCTWALDVRFNRTSCTQVHDLAQSHCGDNREGTLFSWLHRYYPHLASVRFEHSVYRGSLMTTYI